MFKKVLSLTLAITIAVSMFCGCSNTQNTQATEKETAITRVFVEKIRIL